jgi:hypothetical protein
VQYRLELRHRATGETADGLVAGRMFAAPDAAERWLAQFGPLAHLVAGRNDQRALSRPVLHVRELGLVLHAFPLDPGLPGLVAATDPTQLVERLGPLHQGSVPGLVLEHCRAETVRYRVGSCVLRYELLWRIEPSRRSLKQVVYGKVYADDRGRLVGPVVIALRHLLDTPGALPFLVPRFQTYLPDLRLALLEAMPGSPLLPALIRARARAAGAPPLPGLSPEVAVAACARIGAALHRSSIPVGATRTLAGELDGVRATVDAIAPMAPALAAALHRSLRAVGDLASDAPGPLGVAHGDFDASQVLFGGSTASLVDFDTVCLAEPALDLGQFTGHLAASVRKAIDAVGASPNGGDDLSAGFLREYVRVNGIGDPDALLARVAAYRTLTLTRLAVRNWSKLKPQRVGPILNLLDQPQPIRVP